VLKESFLEWDFPEDIPLEKREQYVFIDARITPEYEEEHIEGAINIPLESLRQKYPELDPSQEYYTYCTADSRGMAAAFLLRSQGFKAKQIRGGLSAWEGAVTHGSDGVHIPQADK
jgi:rhodanese-related sulfurtransferase